MGAFEHNHNHDHVHPPLRSEFADDQDMVELIAYFIEELEHRVQALSGALIDGDGRSLRTLAHQLKGAAAGYGYPSITDVAAQIEHELLQDEGQVSDVVERVEELITLCRRAAAIRK